MVRTRPTEEKAGTMRQDGGQQVLMSEEEGTKIEPAVRMQTNNHAYDDYGERGSNMYLQLTRQGV